LGGLGLDTTTTDAQKPAWAAGGSNIEFPVHYNWEFITGENEDFESLVKILEPRVMDQRIGIRDMDGTKPGFGMTEGTDIGLIKLEPENPGDPEPPLPNQEIIGLEGALKSPKTKSRPLALDLTKPFFLN
jgi:hypothetical protein